MRVDLDSQIDGPLGGSGMSTDLYFESDGNKVEEEYWYGLVFQMNSQPYCI